MKMYCSANSPYARKARVIAYELGIHDQITLLDTNPHEPANDLLDVNPLSKIPALVAKNGDLIIDSPVICEYLNEVYGKGRLLPSQTDKLWQMRSLVALSDGVLDSGMVVRLEGMRTPELQSKAWMDQQIATVQRGLARLELEVDKFSNDVNLLGISLACTIQWLMFRFDHIDWLKPNPKISAWFKTFTQRESMQKTAPGKPL